PSTSATTQIAAKTVPMTNIVGTTTPEAISSSCTAEPSQMPDGRRTRPAATTHSSASPPATPQIGPTLGPGSRSPKATSAANSTTKTSKVSTAEHSTARAERRRGRAAGEELTRSGYGLDRGSSRRRGPASGLAEPVLDLGDDGGQRLVRLRPGRADLDLGAAGEAERHQREHAGGVDAVDRDAGVETGRGPRDGRGRPRVQPERVDERQRPGAGAAVVGRRSPGRRAARLARTGEPGDGG